MQTAIAFLVTLGVLIVVHEWGHYRAAVACGVKVLRFSVGFGPVLWRRVRGADRTEFVVSALPLGGYVRMLDEREGIVDAADAGRAFNRKPLSQRAFIVAAGPLANLILAVLLYAVASWIGTEEPKAVLSAGPTGSLIERAGLNAGDVVLGVESEDGTTVVPLQSMPELRWQVTQALVKGQDIRLQVAGAGGGRARMVSLPLSRLAGAEVGPATLAQVGLTAPYREAVLGEVRAGGAAQEAGLRKGDRVLRIDGAAISDANMLFERIRSSPLGGQPRAQQWQIQREGQAMEITVTPRVVQQGGTAIGRIEAFVGGPAAMVLVRKGPLEGISDGVSRTWELSALSLRMLGKMLIGEASLKNLSGPITIADYAGQSAQQGLAYYIGFLAMVSVSLGVLNLLPLPMLDGGHLMYYLFEAISGRPVSDAWLGRLQRGGVAILLLMMSVALFNDVARLLGLH